MPKRVTQFIHPTSRVVFLRLPDKVSGYAMLFGSLLGIACYFYLVFLSPWALLVVRVSAFLAVAAVLVIVAWIGYTLVTTPLPEPLDFSMEDTEGEAEPGG